MIGLTLGQWEALIGGGAWVIAVAVLALLRVIESRRPRSFTERLARLGDAVTGARRYSRR